MAVNVAPSGKAPPGRLWSGAAATMVPATALPVAACGSPADNSAATAEAYTLASPEDGGSDGRRCQMIDPGLIKAAFLTGAQFGPADVAIAHNVSAAWVDTCAPGNDEGSRLT